MAEEKDLNTPLDDRILGSEWLGWEDDRIASEVSIREGKGLYLALSIAYYALLFIILAGVIYLIWPRLFQFHPRLPLITLIAAGLAFFMMLLKFLLPVISVYTGVKFFSLPLLQSWQVPFPNRMVFIIGRLLGISQDRIANAYVHYNNALVQIFFRRKGDRVLVLLPRCLQHVQCEQKIFEHIRHCKECGKCAVSQLKKLSEALDIPMMLATGGTYARQLIKTTNPGFIVAVACERELLSGLKAIRRIPVIGIPNRRPEGPCKNTEVDIVEVEEALKAYSRSDRTAPVGDR
jgi:hypothetical protein